MRVQDLIWELEQLDPNAEVKIAYQPSYPMCCDTDDTIAVSEDGKTIYIAQTAYGGNDYLPSEIARQLEYRD